MTDEVDFEIMNEVNDELCAKCNDRYWEACLGITSFLNRIQACSEAKKLYYKKLEEAHKND